MPFDLTPIDAVAFGWFLAFWGGYALVFDHLLRRPISLNQYMWIERRAWMRAMLDRDNRIVDAVLIGNLIQSVAFFASTTMLLVAGLLGILAALDEVYAAVIALSFTIDTPKPLFELKVLLLLGIFVFAFFKFTWALRQFNYGCALVGAAPLPPVRGPERDPLADRTADILSLAVIAFNGGLRAFYFALAALTWLVQPWLFMAVTALVVLVLVRRHLFSDTARAVRGHSRAVPPERRPGTDSISC